MSVFVHAQGIKTVHAGGGGVKKWQNSVHVVVEWPLKRSHSSDVHWPRNIFMSDFFLSSFFVVADSAQMH